MLAVFTLQVIILLLSSGSYYRSLLLTSFIKSIILGHGAAQCDIKVLILLYSNDKKAYLGFIPNDQAQFVDRIRMVIQQQKSKQALVSKTKSEDTLVRGI